MGYTTSSHQRPVNEPVQQEIIMAQAIVPMLAAMGSTAISTAMNKPPAQPKTPTAPVVDDKTSQMNQQRKAARAYAGQGRAGTALTESNTLG